MKNCILITLAVCLPTCLLAQKNDSMHLHWKITTKPTELLLGNIPITVEKVYERHTLGLTVAYRPAYQSGGDIGSISSGMGGGYEIQYVANKVVQGIYVGVNSKNYIFGHNRKFYVDPELFFRRWWCNDKQMSFNNVEKYRFNATRTESVNVYGLKMLIGRSFVFFKTSPVKLVMETYCGIGVREKTWTWESANGYVGNTYYNNKTENGAELLPSVHVGVQFGVGF